MWVDYWGAKGYVAPPPLSNYWPPAPPPPPPSSYAYVYISEILQGHVLYATLSIHF